MLTETPGSFENQSQLLSLLIWAEGGGADKWHRGLGGLGDQRERDTAWDMKGSGAHKLNHSQLKREGKCAGGLQ